MVKKYLAPLSIILRWGHNVIPKWIFGEEVIAPPANTTLASFNTTKRAFIYGFYIFSDEPNDFLLGWKSNNVEYSYLISTGSRGTTYFADTIPLNEGLPADPNTTIELKNTISGSSGMKYRAGLLIGEVI